MHRPVYYALAAIVACLLAASPALGDGNPAPALKVLVLPVNVKIYSFTANGALEDSPDATSLATTTSEAELRHVMSSSQFFQPIAMPALSPDEQAALNEHIALYKAIAVDAHIADDIGDAWKAPLATFDYTLGPGLQFLRQRSGADYALVLQGEDAESTGGRIGMSIFAAMLGVNLAKGRNYICAGLIDLNTGNVVWLNYDTHDASDFSNQKKMAGFVDDIMQDYPDGSLHASSVTVPAGTGH